MSKQLELMKETYHAWSPTIEECIFRGEIPKGSPTVDPIRLSNSFKLFSALLTGFLLVFVVVILEMVTALYNRMMIRKKRRERRHQAIMNRQKRMEEMRRSQPVLTTRR